MITERLQVPTPTKEDFKKVVQCMLDNGNVWMSGKKDVLEEYWYKYKDNTIICLNYYGGNEITYDHELEDDYTTYTTQEFLDKYNKKEEEIKINIMTPFNTDNTIMQTQKDYKLDDKTMNIKKFVKTLTLSKEDKLLREYGLQNDCGDFTEEARELVINKLVEENKAYLVEIATKLKEEDKK
jgi:bacterioferritin-associated ferredoxin